MRTGDFFAVPLGTGDHGIGLVTALAGEGVVEVHLFARAWSDPPPPLALALTQVAPGEAIWGTAVDDRPLRRGRWPIIGAVPELHVEEWTLPAVEPGVARPEEVVDRLTRLFASSRPEAHLFARGRWFIVVGLALAESGFNVEVEPAERLPHTISDADLGAAVRAVLERPVATVPDPPPDRPIPSVAAAGCRTYGQFNRGARLLEITAFEDRLLLTPMRKVYRRGFEPMGVEKRMVGVAGDARLGAAVRVALARAR